jgi:uncharacterized protein YjbI with pentapeptide repeats
MAQQGAIRNPDWPMCRTGGCIGVRVDRQEHCLAHLDSQTRKTVLAALKPGAHLNLRGTPIDLELLSQVLVALRSEDGPPTLGDARFDRAQFTGNAEFKDVRFTGVAGFWGAQFTGKTWFSWARFYGAAEFQAAQFTGDARFDHAQFSRDARFRRVQFAGDAEFQEAYFSGDAEFQEAQFTGDTRFERARFDGTAGFSAAQFSGNIWFQAAQFNRDAWFQAAQFNRDAWFGEARFIGLARFAEARFKRAGTFGPVLAVSTLALDGATFEQDTTIEAVAAAMFCVGTRFAEAVTLRLRRTQIVVDGAVFAKPSTIAFAPDPFKHYDREVEAFGEGPVAQADSGQRSRPQLLSLRGVDVTTLTLSELDLAACLFQGAHHLDHLRIEGARPFGDTPGAWRLRLGRWWVPVWRRWSRRQTLAEEHHWRREPASPPSPGRGLRLTRPAWHDATRQIPGWVAVRTGQEVQRLTPDRLAVLYRALRKAQEDSKNEPGAADFYYGEMEMRRLDRHTPWAERVIVWLYWLVSGYGLRGLRALAWLVTVVVGLAGLLQAIGFNGADPSFRDALIYSAQSTISIASSNKTLTEHVSWAGEVLRIVLRLTGPVLLGLALLAIRNRVKR